MNREKTIIRTSFVGILANVLLVVGKAIIGLIASSIAIILDAINNLTDAISSVVTIIGTKLSNKKPDAKHPYGHGRIEYITSVIIAAIILFAGVTAIKESITALIEGKEATYSYVSIIIIGIAIVVKVALGIFFRIMAKKTNSDALKGSGIDALFDALLSLGTLAAIVVSLIWHVNIEGYIGIVIGLFILKSGIDLLISGFSDLIGKRASPELTRGIKSLVASHEHVLGVYDIILNSYGPQRIIGSLHIEVDEGLTAKDIHPLTRKISEEVYVKYGVILTVGIYAKNGKESEAYQMRQKLQEIVAKYPEIKQYHGFYYDVDRNSVTFDLVIGFECKNPNYIRNLVFEEMKEAYPLPDYFIVIDQDFSD